MWIFDFDSFRGKSSFKLKKNGGYAIAKRKEEKSPEKTRAKTKKGPLTRKKKEEVVVSEEFDSSDDSEEYLEPETPVPSKKKYPLIQDESEISSSAFFVEEEFEGEMSEDRDIASRQCRICFKVFATRDKLRRHATAHQGDPETFCGVCKVPIKYKYNLKNHLYKCLESRRKDFEPSRLNAAYPGFLDDCQKAALDPTIPLPSLDKFPYKMDKNGLVSGYDANLDITLDLMAGKNNREYNVDNLIKKVIDE
uniref:C2H2-type domain-containing protein n=1 Tax=Caenorhabditis tropicalis TaxID=1561998 RepID=A0A1I7UIJ5_9PELO